MSEDKVKEILSELIAELSIHPCAKEAWFVFLFSLHLELPQTVILAIQLNFYRENSSKEKIFFLFKKIQYDSLNQGHTLHN